jgi:hypothetical protein
VPLNLISHEVHGVGTDEQEISAGYGSPLRVIDDAGHISPGSAGDVWRAAAPGGLTEVFSRRDTSIWRQEASDREARARGPLGSAPAGLG